MMNEFLEYISTFIDLTSEEKETIINLDNFKSFKQGTYLIKEGEIAHYYYIVVKGCLRSFYMIDGKEKTTAFYEKGEAATPISYIDKKPSEYYIQCAEDCLLGYANSEMELLVFKKFPRFKDLCKQETDKELIIKQADLDSHLNLTPDQRYIRLMQQRPELFRRIPQYQIASYLGIEPETLSRIKKRMMNKKQ